MTSIGGGFSPYDKKEIIQSINELQKGVRDTLDEEITGLLETIRVSRRVRFFDWLILGVSLVAAGAATIGVLVSIYK